MLPVEHIHRDRIHSLRMINSRMRLVGSDAIQHMVRRRVENIHLQHIGRDVEVLPNVIAGTLRATGDFECHEMVLMLLIVDAMESIVRNITAEIDPLLLGDEDLLYRHNEVLDPHRLHAYATLLRVYRRKKKNYGFDEMAIVLLFPTHT